MRYSTTTTTSSPCISLYILHTPFSSHMLTMDSTLTLTLSLLD